MKIKIIDLLNRIANNEWLPIKIKYNNEIYEYENNEYGYVREENTIYYMFLNEIGNSFLNDEVEIIEEKEVKGKKIPEKINNSYYHLGQDQQNQLFKKLYSETLEEKDQLSNIIDDLREYMLDIDYKMGWQYAEYLDELLGIKSNYKKYGIAIDLKEESKNE